MSHKNQCDRPDRHAPRLILGYLLIIIVLLGLSLVAHGLPQGGVVTDGQATISSTPNHTQINQSSNSAVYNWQSFNIEANESTHFQQPGSQSTAINRINAANGASKIFGKLTSNGRIFLLNPSGVLFGPNAQVNVASILASTSDLDIMKYRQTGMISLIPNNNYHGSITNLGTITVQDAGFAAFVAPNVANHGIINARLGHVQLSTGSHFTVDLYGDNLINFAVPEQTLNPELKNTRIDHTGAIYADGGSIVMSAAQAGDIVSSVISFDGVARADVVADSKGKISLLNKDGLISVGSNAKIYARNNNDNTQTGTVKVVGKDVKLAKNSLIDVSGVKKAGDVKIGGNYQGKQLTDTDFNSQTVTMEKDATILANSKANNGGGNIILWSDQTTNVNGILQANGGLVETSGKLNLNIGNDINVATKSLNGLDNNGLWLLDPINLNVNNSLAATISTALNAGNNVEIRTSDGQADPNAINYADNTSLDGGVGTITGGGTNGGDINFTNSQAVAWNSPANFAVIADKNIIFARGTDSNPQIMSTGAGNILLQTNSNGLYAPNSGQILFNGTANTPYITANTGKIDYYIDPTVLGTKTIFNAAGSNITPFIANNLNNINEYQYIYSDSHWAVGDPNSRGITRASTLLSKSDVNYALHEDIAFTPASNFNGFGNIVSGAYLANFDGMNHTIDGLKLSNFFTITDQTYAGLFRELKSTKDSPQEIKNLKLTNASFTPVTATAGDPITAGLLIGHAINSSAAPILISNINITDSNLNLNNPATSTLGSLGTAGGLIGLIDSPTNLGSLSLNNIALKNTNIEASHMAGGLIGNVANNNMTLGTLLLDNVSVKAAFEHDLAGNFNDTYAGGLFAATNPNLRLISNNNITINNGSTIKALNKSPGANSYAGGLIADFTGANAVFNGNITLDLADLSAEQNNTAALATSTNTSPMAAYAGGLFGNAKLNSLVFTNNSKINISDAPTAHVTADNVDLARAYAGGLTGYQQSLLVNYNGLINTNGAIANAALDPTATGINFAQSYAGGIDGATGDGASVFNYQIAPTSMISVGNNIQATSIGKNESAFAGGLFGLVNSSLTQPSIINFASNNPITIDALNISALTSGRGLILDPTDKFMNATSAGGLAGSAVGTNIAFSNNNSIDIGSANSTTGVRSNILALSTNSISSSPISAAGGLFGSYVGGDLSFDFTQPNFVVKNIGDIASNGYSAGVIGYLDVGELSPSIAGLISGSVSPDKINDNADWSNSSVNFAFNTSLACGGPSAILCNGNPPTTPPSNPPTTSAPTPESHENYNNLFSNDSSSPAVTYITSMMSNLGTSVAPKPITSVSTDNKDTNQQLDNVISPDFFTLPGGN